MVGVLSPSLPFSMEDIHIHNKNFTQNIHYSVAVTAAEVILYKQILKGHKHWCYNLERYT